MATFGDERWIEIGERAAQSVARQTRPPAELIWIHGPDLHIARNAAIGMTRSDFACFVDADDAVDCDFVAVMSSADPSIDIVWPAVSIDGKPSTLISRGDLRRTNFIYISARFRVDRYRSIGGTRRLPALEDWDVWTRMWLAGATIGGAVDAVLQKVEDGAGHRNARSNAFRRFQLQRSWARLPHEWGGLRAPSLVASLSDKAARTFGKRG
jgi:glycosyltransferase involved in cell wall biosynthesis